MSTEDVPDFATFEELQKWLDSQKDSNEENSKDSKVANTPKKESASSTKTKSAGTKKPKKPPFKDSGVTLAGVIAEEVASTVWCSVHFYTRPGTTIGVTRNDAKEEAEYRNDNVKVCYHDHIFGKECVSACGMV